MQLRARDFLFEFPRPTLVMGVMNVTPDSFSDQGSRLSPEEAVDYALRLIDEGADIVDIGGESTRPGATPVSPEEEISRVIPVIRRLAGRVKVAISVDTMKPEVAEQALDAGACIVNDVAAHRTEDNMWQCVARHKAGYVAMHMQGTPMTMQKSPHYADVVKDVDEFLGERLMRLGACGVGREQVILDPGIGFGKTHEHNLTLLANVESFLRWQRPVLLGLSRKSFVGHVTGVTEPSQRVPGSVSGAVWACTQGVQMIRTHDVAATCQALRMVEAILIRTRRQECTGRP
jgi:dihydropteroate synthase